MDCLRCGTKLAILNRISGGAFCSPEHRTQFLAHQDAVMLGRLKDQALRLKRLRVAIPGSLGELIAICPYIAELDGYPSSEPLPELFQGFEGFPTVVVAAGTPLPPFNFEIPAAVFRFARLEAGNPTYSLPPIAPLDPENRISFFPVMRHESVALVLQILGKLFAARKLTVIGPRTVNAKAGPSPSALMSVVLYPATPLPVSQEKAFPVSQFQSVRVAIAHCGIDVPTGLEPVSFTTRVMPPASHLTTAALVACRRFARIPVRAAQPHLDSLKPADLSDWSVEEPANLPVPKTSALVFTPQFGAMISLPLSSSLSNPGALPIALQALALPATAPLWNPSSNTSGLVFTPQSGTMINLPAMSSLSNPGALPIALQALAPSESAPLCVPSPKTSGPIFSPQFGAMISLPTVSSLSNPGALAIGSEALPLAESAPLWNPSPKTSGVDFTPQSGTMIQLPAVSSPSNPGAMGIASKALPLPLGAPLWNLCPKTAFLTLEYSNRVAPYRFFARSSGVKKLSIEAVTSFHTDPVVFTPSMRIASAEPALSNLRATSLSAVDHAEKFSGQIVPLPADISMVGPELTACLMRSPMPAMAGATQRMQGPEAVGPHELKAEEALPFERKTLKPDFKVISVRSQPRIPEPARHWWAGMPMPVQRVLMILPVLLGVSFYFMDGKASTAAAKQRPMTPVSENFSAGLKSWNGAAGWSKTWKTDAGTGVEPGSLALLTSTQPFADYEMGFNGAIEKKSMGFAVRAADLKNYYAVKISYRKSGKNPGLYIVRYPVIAGKSEKATEVPLRVEQNPEAEMRVKMDVSGDTYTLSVGGQVADSWNEARLTHGAVGFFAAKDERFRVQNISVTPE